VSGERIVQNLESALAKVKAAGLNAEEWAAALEDERRGKGKPM